VDAGAGENRCILICADGAVVGRACLCFTYAWVHVLGNPSPPDTPRKRKESYMPKYGRHL
jgi:hypothetical protein